MKMQQKKRIVQKLWGWFCLSINCLIMTLLLREKFADYLTSGILLSLSIFGYGVVKTQLDKSKNDLSGVSVAIEYICIYLITFLSAFKITALLSTVRLLPWLTIVSLIELLIFLLITYWHPIQKFFRKRQK